MEKETKKIKLTEQDIDLKKLSIFNSKKNSWLGFFLDTFFFVLAFFSIMILFFPYNNDSGKVVYDGAGASFAQWLFENDWIFCLLFLVEFVFRWIVHAINNRLIHGKTIGYISFPFTIEGFISLLTIVPMFFYLPIWNVLRVFRMFISKDMAGILKKVPFFGGVILAMEYLAVSFKKQARTLFVVTVIFLIIIFIFALLIFNVEQLDPGAFHYPEDTVFTLGDAFWFTFVTITTIGYGDYYAVNTAGRTIVVILSLVGIAFLAIYTAVIVNGFSSTEIEAKIHSMDRKENKRLKKLEQESISEMDSLRKQIDELEIVNQELEKMMIVKKPVAKKATPAKKENASKK